MTKKEIYRKLSKIYHPDVSGDEEIFKKINEAYNIDIFELAKIYKNLTGKNVKINFEKIDKIDELTKHNSIYKQEIFEDIKNFRNSKGYNTHTAEGMMRFWADSLIDRINSIKYIENLIVSGIEVRISIRWIKKANNKYFWQVSHTNGKFWNFQDYTNAILNTLKIKQLGDNKRRING